MSDPPLVLTGRGLALEDVVAVARGRRRLELDPAAAERVAAARAVGERAQARGDAVYGLTRGIGALRHVELSADEAPAHARLTLLAHRTTHGPLLAPEAVRAAMLARANTLANGGAAVRPELVLAYLEALNDDAEPDVRAIGSVGVSDLPQMAEIGCALVERGLEPRAGEPLPMLNANALSTGLGALALADSERLVAASEVAGAVSLEAFGANLSVLHPEVARARPSAGLATSLARLRDLLEGSSQWRPDAARSLQDPLSFRCLPQLAGAARDALAYARAQVETELNCAPENPLVVVKEDRLVSVGNFDAGPVAAALDLARLALAPLLTASCERVQKLLTPAFSGLPTGLRAGAGPEDALALVGVGTAGLAAECRLLCQPVSLELPTSTIAGGIEDRVTMAALGARRLAELAGLAARLLAAELVVACQALDLRRPPALGRGTAAAHAAVRRRVAFVGHRQAPVHDLDSLAAWVLAEEGPHAL